MDILTEEIRSLSEIMNLDIISDNKVKDCWINNFIDIDQFVKQISTCIRNGIEEGIIFDIISTLSKLCKSYVALSANLEVPASEGFISIPNTPSSNASVLSSIGSELEDNEEINSGSETVPPVEEKQKDFWSLLFSNNIPPKKILVFVYSLIRFGRFPSASLVDQELSFKSAALYFNLLSVPGCLAYRIMQGSIFEEALNVFTRTEEINSDEVEKPSAKLTKHTKNTVVFTSSESEGEEEDFRPTKTVKGPHLSHNRKVILSQEALKELLHMLDKLSLDGHKEHKEIIIQLCIDLIVLFPEDGMINFESGTRITIPRLCYKLLQILILNNFHGPNKEICLEIFKRMLPLLLKLLSEERSKIVIKDQLVDFIKHLMKKEPSAFESANILIQQLCLHGPEKTDNRLKVAQMVVTIVRCFPLPMYVEAINWFYKFLRQSKIPYRMLGLDIFLTLLLEKGLMPGQEPTSPLISQEMMLLAVLTRTKDKSATVRARALTVLSQDGIPLEVLCGLNEQTYAERSSAINQSDISHVNEIVEILAARSQDDKANVKKAVLQVMERLVFFNQNNLTNAAVDILKELCHDSSVLVRKQVCTCITSILLRHSTSHRAQNLWIETVLPLSLDGENSMKDKSLECIEEILMNNLNNRDNLSWVILNRISHGDYQSSQLYVKKALYRFIEKGRISSQFLFSLRNQMDKENSKVVWLILSFLSSGTNPPNINWALEVCQNVELSTLADEATKTHMIQVLGNNACHIKAKKIKKVLKNIQNLVENLNQKLEIIRSALKTIFQLTKQLTVYKQDEETMLIVKDWSKPLVETCNNFLNNLLLKDGKNDLIHHEDKIICHMITLAEIGAYCGLKIQPSTKIFLQFIINEPVRIDANDELPESQDLPFTCENYFSQTQKDSQFVISLKLKNHALITLGKFCLQSEQLAKEVLLLFVKELKTSKQFAVRNNIVMILSDFCIRYPNMIEPYLPSMTACLRDESSFVRHQVLTTLTQLLQEDYLKWKSSLFFRVLRVCVDNVQEVASLAEYVLKHLLNKRRPAFYFQNFIESIFFFNGYTKNEKYNHFTEGEQDIELFSLKGNKYETDRLTLYNFLLSNMSIVEKIQMNSRICQDVLSLFVDGVIPLEKDSSPIVKDCLNILLCDEIKMGGHFVTSTEDPNDDPENQISAPMAAVKKNLLQSMKRMMAENTLFVLVALKHLLEKHKSPLLKECLGVFKVFCKEFKNEMEEIFAGDPQVAKEIAFDLKQLEQEEIRKEKAAKEKERLLNKQAEKEKQPPRTLELSDSSDDEESRTEKDQAQPPRTLNRLDSSDDEAQLSPKQLKENELIKKIKNTRLSVLVEKLPETSEIEKPTKPGEVEKTESSEVEMTQEPSEVEMTQETSEVEMMQETSEVEMTPETGEIEMQP